MSIHEQSPDIAQGVDKKKVEEQGAGDQRVNVWLCYNETKELMPLPILLAQTGPPFGRSAPQGRA